MRCLWHGYWMSCPLNMVTCYYTQKSDGSAGDELCSVFCHFRMNLTEKLNHFNRELQGKVKTVAHMINVVNIFKAKMNILSVYAEPWAILTAQQQEVPSNGTWPADTFQQSAIISKAKITSKAAQSVRRKTKEKIGWSKVRLHGLFKKKKKKKTQEMMDKDKANSKQLTSGGQIPRPGVSEQLRVCVLLLETLRRVASGDAPQYRLVPLFLIKPFYT